MVLPAVPYDVYGHTSERVTIGLTVDKGADMPPIDEVMTHLERLIHEGGPWREYAESGERRSYTSVGPDYNLVLDVFGPTTDAELAGVAAQFAVAYQQ